MSTHDVSNFAHCHVDCLSVVLILLLISLVSVMKILSPPLSCWAPSCLMIRFVSAKLSLLGNILLQLLFNPRLL